jgi:hypothetical protein
MAAVDAGFERSVARWLRAYPPRWRRARAAEVTALLADLAPPEATRLDLRSAAGLVAGGWATRWREHPPLLPWLGYRLLGTRLDPRYREWAQDDLDSPWLAARQVLAGVVLLAAALAQQIQLEWTPFLMSAVAVLVATVIGPRVYRAQAVAKQLVVQPGEVVTHAARLPALVARRRLAARPWLSGALVLCLVTSVGSTALLLGAPAVLGVVPQGVAEFSVEAVPLGPAARTVLVGLVLVAGLVGLAASRAARRRLHRWAPAPQPYREVAAATVEDRTRLAAVLVLLLVVAFGLPSFGAALAVPAGVLAAGALPVVLTARAVVAAGGTRAVAGVDVLRATVGRTDRRDEAVPGHVPATTWLPLGAVVPGPDVPPAPPSPALDGGPRA